jgi:hypothetical protein
MVIQVAGMPHHHSFQLVVGGILVCVAATLVAATSAFGLIPLKTGQYKGKIGNVGSLSFKVEGEKSAHLEDFKIVIFGQPTCDMPVPETWPYELPISGKFDVVTDVVLSRNTLFPEQLELSFGFYPFPVVSESADIQGDVIQFLGEIKRKNTIVGRHLLLSSDDFLPNDPDVNCRYRVFDESWKAKHR